MGEDIPKFADRLHSRMDFINETLQNIKIELRSLQEADKTNIEKFQEKVNTVYSMLEKDVNALSADIKEIKRRLEEGDNEFEGLTNGLAILSKEINYIKESVKHINSLNNDIIRFHETNRYLSSQIKIFENDLLVLETNLNNFKEDIYSKITNKSQHEDNLAWDKQKEKRNFTIKVISITTVVLGAIGGIIKLIVELVK